MKIEIDFEGAGGFGGQACKYLFSVLALNCETDDGETISRVRVRTCRFAVQVMLVQVPGGVVILVRAARSGLNSW